MLAVLGACLIVLPGPVVEPFGPIGAYGGHWGVDVAIMPRAAVVAPLTGTVSFAGQVAGVRTVTIRHGTGRVSVSYLSEMWVETGQRVERGEWIGRSGVHAGRHAVHISVRRGERYVDPQRWTCPGGDVGGTLRLLPPMLAGLVEAPS